jgi:hypothetical protein
MQVDEQAQTIAPKCRSFAHWLTILGVHLLSTLVVMAATSPIGALVVKLTEGSTEAEILFMVCYYVFCMALAVPIARKYLPPTNPTKPAIDYFWPFLGLVPGTFLIAWSVLSGDPIQRLTGGLMYGGVPLGLFGLAYAIYRRNRQWRRQQLPAPLDAATSSGEN